MRKVFFVASKDLYSWVMIVIFVLSVYSQNNQWIKLGWSREVTSMVLKNELLWIACEDGIYTINTSTGSKDFIDERKIDILHDHDIITSLAANNAGEVWFGTAGGKIFRYDGQNFHSFDNLYKEDNYIYCMAFDRNNHLWIGMEEGLLCYDGEDWYYYYDKNSGLPENRVTNLTFDDAGNIWIATYWGGITKYDGRQWITYHSHNSGLPEDNVTCMAFDRDGRIWVGTLAGIAVFNGKDWVVFNSKNSGLPDDRINAVAVDEDGYIWIGTKNGVAKFDGQSWMVYHPDNSGLICNQIDFILIDESDKWFGTRWGGLVKFDGSNWFNQSIYLSPLPYQGYQQVTSVFMDKDGNKWIGLFFTDKIFRFNSGKWVIYDTLRLCHYLHNIVDIDQDKKGNLWFATKVGLLKFNGKEWIWFNSSNSYLPTNQITCMAVDGNGYVWLGTEEHGLLKFNGKRWKVYNKRNSGLPDNRIDVLAIDRQNNCWIGTDRGVTCFNGKTWKTYNTNNSPLPQNWVCSIKIGNDNKVWLGFPQYQIMTFDGKKWDLLKAGKGSEFTSSSSQINSIAFDQNGGAWFGTINEIIHYNGNEWELYYVNNMKGYILPNSGVKDLMFDQYGNLWVAYNYGVFIFNPTGISEF